MDQKWTWAGLNEQQVSWLREAESALGADYLLAFRPERPASDRAVDDKHNRLPVASLNESQLECLHGVESRLDAVVVAYQRGL
jgi:hypothetical protein